MKIYLRLPKYSTNIVSHLLKSSQNYIFQMLGWVGTYTSVCFNNLPIFSSCYDQAYSNIQHTYLINSPVSPSLLHLLHHTLKMAGLIGSSLGRTNSRGRNWSSFQRFGGELQRFRTEFSKTLIKLPTCFIYQGIIFYCGYLVPT